MTCAMTTYTLCDGAAIGTLDTSKPLGLNIRMIYYMSPPFAEYVLGDGYATEAHGVISRANAPAIYYACDSSEDKPKDLRVCMKPGLQVEAHPDDAEAFAAYFEAAKGPLKDGLVDIIQEFDATAGN